MVVGNQKILSWWMLRNQLFLQLLDVENVLVVYPDVTLKTLPFESVHYCKVLSLHMHKYQYQIRSREGIMMSIHMVGPKTLSQLGTFLW